MFRYNFVAQRVGGVRLGPAVPPDDASVVHVCMEVDGVSLNGSTEAVLLLYVGSHAEQ